MRIEDATGKRRLTSGAHTLIIEGPSYRQRDRLNQRVAVDTKNEARDAH